MEHKESTGSTPQTIEEILKSGLKPKQIVVGISLKLELDRSLMPELLECLADGTDSARGHCIEAIEHATLKDPDLVVPYLNVISHSLSDKAPRVRWEAARIIGNVARRFPAEVESTIPGLIANTGDKGTVVRWSAAFALAEIAKANSSVRTDLLTRFPEIMAKESSNGVKNIYLKAMKSIEKAAQPRKASQEKRASKP
jgi:hypothetical protein